MDRVDSSQFLKTVNGHLNAKDLVMRILGKEWPLSAKEIFIRIKKEASGNFSYQGVHKAMQQLCAEGVLVKKDNHYLLNIDWIRREKQNSTNLEEKYISGFRGFVSAEAKLHPHLIFYPGREKTVKSLTEIMNRAEKGDLLFGMCRTGTDYPSEFYDALSKSVGRGVKINLIIPKSIEASFFVKFLLDLKRESVQIRTTRSEYIRMMGIVDKQVLIAIAFPDAYFGLHFIDKGVSDYFYNYFLQFWKKSKVLK